jgi:hypothetical protein
LRPFELQRASLVRLHELAAAYEAATRAAQPPASQHASIVDGLEAERRFIDGSGGEAALEFWRRWLDGAHTGAPTPTPEVDR